MRGIRVLASAPLLLLVAFQSSTTGRSLAGPDEMLAAAQSFLAGLDAEQRARATFPFEDAERVNWFFTPVERRGLPLKDMTEQQRANARALAEAGLGQRGFLKAQTVMELEQVLRDLGGNPDMRDPLLYFVTIFGTPSATEPWGWRFEGHHLSVNFTIVANGPVGTAPAFFGANPARVASGPREGLRALAQEEDLARALVRSLNEEQRAAAMIATESLGNIVTGNEAQVDPLEPTGIPASQLDTDQKSALIGLIAEYLARMAPDLAEARRARLEQTDFDRVAFAWAGSIEPGQPHYYRVQGPSFLIEFDNTPSNANHIHSVWRDFEGDFGRDLLREHYLNAPAAHGH